LTFPDDVPFSTSKPRASATFLITQVEEYTGWLQALKLVGESFVDQFTPKKGALYSPREHHAFIWQSAG